MHVRMQEDHPDDRHEQAEIVNEEFDTAALDENLNIRQPWILPEFFGTFQQVLIIAVAEEPAGKMIVEAGCGGRVFALTGHKNGMNRTARTRLRRGGEEILIQAHQQFAPGASLGIVQRMMQGNERWTDSVELTVPELLPAEVVVQQESVVAV